MVFTDNVEIGYVFLQGLFGDRLINTIDILTTKNSITDLSNYSVRCTINVFNGIPVPVVDAQNSINASTIVGVVRSVKNRSDLDNLSSQFYNYMLSKGYKITEDEIKNLFYFIFDKYIPYIGKKDTYEINIANIYYDQTNSANVKRAVDEMNAISDPFFRYLGNSPNVTKLQHDVFDELSFELPKYKEFIAGFTTVVDLFPDVTTIIPRPHEIFLTPYWGNIVGKDRSLWPKYLLGFGKLNGQPFTIDDINSIPDFSLNDVIGSPENDNEPVLVHEKEMYDKLCRFIEVDNQFAQKSEGSDLSRLGGISENMENYLYQAIHEFAFFNWSCTGKFPKVEPDAYDSDDDDLIVLSESNNDSYLSYDEQSPHFWGGSNGVFKDGFNRLLLNGPRVLWSYITQCAQLEGSHIYALAIIKLARRGAIKPRCLYLTDKLAPMNMTTFMLNVEAEDFNNYEIAKINGRELSLCGIITFSADIRDTEYLRQINMLPINSTYKSFRELPVGIITIRKFVNGQEQYVYMAITEAVSEYLNGNALIDGIDYANGKFAVDMNKISDRQELSQLLKLLEESITNQGVLYISVKLQELCQSVIYKAHEVTDLQVLSNIVQQSMSISMWYPDTEFHTKEAFDLITKRSDVSKKTCLTVNIGKYLLNVILLTNNKVQMDASLPLVLDATKSSFDELGIRSCLDFWGKNPIKTSTNNYIDSTVSQLRSMTSFSDNSSVAKDKVEVSGIDTLFNHVSPDHVVYPVISKSGDNRNIILYVAKDNKGIFTLISIEEANKDGFNNISKSDINVRQLTHFVWSTLQLILTNQCNSSKVKFYSKDSLNSASIWMIKNYQVFA